MNYLSYQLTFREIPDEVCLSFLISGCPIRCRDCNSKDSWSPLAGKKLDRNFYMKLLQIKKPWITCVLFLGGEWLEELVDFIKIAQETGLKTALFTGAETISEELYTQLDYLKTGPYIKHYGALDNPRTNQKLINLKTQQRIIHFKEECL
ncbi:MAG: 4Fe-4S cluster-binding domain-containing protein [Bdellovibrionales bacterium]|nr:4Fe-4S cluster-binding domain-containing protein [Bdellovibrionales bacterium]